jgi:hypothetical protein
MVVDLWCLARPACHQACPARRPGLGVGDTGPRQIPNLKGAEPEKDDPGRTIHLTCHQTAHDHEHAHAEASRITGPEVT